MSATPKLILRVTLDAPPFSPREPRTWTARDVESHAVGRGLTAGQAVDDLGVILAGGMEAKVVVDVGENGR